METIAERLQELLDREGIEAEDRALAYIARQADGALRDGLSLLEQCISFYFGQKLTYENVLKVLGAVDNTVYHELMGTLVRNKVEGAVELIARVVEQGKDLTQFVNEFVWYLRNLLIVKTTEETGRLVDMSAENIGELQRYAQEIEVEMIFRYIRVLSVLAGEMRYGSNKRVMLEVALIRLCRPQMERDYDSLVNRLHILEQRNEELLEAAASGKLTVAAPDCAGGSAAPESEKEIRPEAVPEDVKAVVANWKQLLGRVSPVARKMLEEVRLSVSDSGLLILAFPQSTTAEYFRREDNQAEVVEAAAQLTGKEIHLDVRLVESRREMNTLPELRNIIKNVEIEILD